MAWTKEDRSFKTLINRRTTSVTKQFYEEFSDNTINFSMSELWIDSLPSDPTVAVNNGLATLYTLFTLTEDNSVVAQQAYYANSGLPSDDPLNPTKPMPLKDWISDKYGANYRIRLFDNSNNEIFPTDASGWFFDYSTGYLTFSGSTASLAKPFKITGYQYIGNKGKVVRDLAVNGTSGQLQVFYTDNTSLELPITGGGGGVSGPLSGLKADYVLVNLAAGIEYELDYNSLDFESIANIQFYENVLSGTNGTSGVYEIQQQAYIDVAIDSVTKKIKLLVDQNVEGFIHIIGSGNITLVGSTPNATTTVKGVVELATQTEFDNGIDVGDTGAPLVVRPSMIINALGDIDKLILPPPTTSYQDYGQIGNWSYDDKFFYMCLPCADDGTSGTCGFGGKVWRRTALERW